MFKSFTGRFFAIYALSTFIIFLLLFGVITQIISSHFIDTRQDAMIEESHAIAQQYVSAFVEKNSSKVGFIYQVQALGRHIDARILVLDTTRTVSQDSNIFEDALVGKIIQLPILDDVYKGKILRETTNLDGYYDELHLLTAIPVYQDSQAVGAILMLSPYPHLEKEINYIYQLTLISLLVMLGVTFGSTYLFSRNISRTIEDLSNSAKRIANGDFTSRVTLDGQGELSELSQSMNYMATELEKLEDMRKDFIANISHDFRSPLTSIKGFIQAMLDGTIPHDKQDRYLNIVLDETDRLTKLTNDILLLTKMENNTIKVDMSVFDLHRVIRKILLQFEQKIIDKKIDFTLLIDRHELFVKGDMNQIQRVITNLVDNAIKFCSPEDSIIVETSIIKDKVEVNIKDSGPGISEEDIKYIWDRFHKADRSRGKDKKGIGLGLSIVREIIKAHGEEINVYSQEGKGTTFVFTLPVADNVANTLPSDKSYS